MVTELLEAFDSLKVPIFKGSEFPQFTACPVSRFPSHRIAKDAHGRPSLLLTLADSADRRRYASVVLEYLAVQYDVDCQITSLDGSVEQRKFTILSCRTDHRILHSYFLQVIGAMLPFLGADPTHAATSRLLTNLVELFRALAGPSQESLQGLWAEIFVIARSHDPASLVRAWHLQSYERYDFSIGSERLEVKATTSRTRIHEFSLEQLLPPNGTEVYVASVLVEASSGGPDIAELADRIRARIPNQLEELLRLERVLCTSLGSKWTESQKRFDLHLAEESLRFFNARAVPSVNANLPLGVSRVHFCSDLSGVEPLNKEQKSQSRLLRACG